MRTLAELQQQFAISIEKGLSPEDVARSRQQFGGNHLTPLPREPLWKKFIEKFDEPIIKILLAAALLSILVDLFKTAAALGALGLALVAGAVAGALLLRQGRWVPTVLFASALVLFVGSVAAGHPSVEGLAVMIAVILATGVAFASEYKSDREFEILNAQKESVQVKVIRDGELHTVPLEEVVVGDVVSLEMGDEIPADGRLLKANELYVDQSLMTGESEPVRKVPRPPDDASEGPEQPHCLYRGTQVVDGVGVLCVTEVGDATYLGQIARRLSAEDDAEAAGESAPAVGGETQRVKQKLTISKELTPLQHKLKNLAELISKVGYAAAALIFVAQLVRGVVTGELHVPADFHDALAVFSFLLDAFVLMVIIIVVAVPEGLPMSVTVSLALAMRKMTRANSLVRQLVACETIGSATVICSDKTGTLTQNKMRVDRLCLEGNLYDRGREGWALPEKHPDWPRDGKPLDWIALNAAVNSTANLQEKAGQLVIVGNHTEGALLQFLREGGLHYHEIRAHFAPLYQMHFSSERKRMTTVIAYDGRLVALVKGAPEWLIEQSTQMQAQDGTTRAFTAAARARVEQSLRDSTVNAMRTLAFAYKVLPPEIPADEDGLHLYRAELENDLVFLGFVGIRDPLRDDVREAIDECRRAGIEVKMITGDNVETARAIGYQIGLIDSPQAPIDGPDGQILTSDRFNALGDDDLKAILPRLRILARARPLDKFRMVRLLQDLGEVVAVTGDGTNDAPALKKADVGLAMGIAGTEVAKEASKIVLLDDAFSTIVKAVHWGRSLYENIQRFIQFQLTINVSALTIAFLGPLLFGVKAPFTVLQLLWINVIMDTFASIALCSEPPRPGVMRQPPKKKDENILTRPMVRTILITAGFFVVVMLALLVGMKGSPHSPGWFAGAEPRVWSVEQSGARLAVAETDLEYDPQERKWFVRKGAAVDAMADNPAPKSNTPAAAERIPVEVAFTVFQVSIFFSVYVFFQVWNQINCRSLTPYESGFHRIWQNPAFLTIAGIVAAGQIVIVSVGGPIFKVQRLDPLTWLAIIAFTSSVLVFAELSRRVQIALKK